MPDEDPAWLETCLLPATISRKLEMTEATIRSLPIWKHDIQIAPMEGGLTNLNYRVTDGEATYAVRTGADDPRLGISRRNELACARIAADLGVAPAIA